MSAAIHPFPGRDPNRAPHHGTDADLLAELAAAVGAPARASSARRPATVTALPRGGAAGSNDLVVVGSPVRGRRALVVVVATLVLAIAFALLAGFGGASADGDAPVAATVTLEGGETLWGLAQEITPADDDVRTTVAAIMDLNDFTSPTLPAGTIVQLPEIAG